MSFNNLALDLNDVKEKHPEDPLNFFKDKRICLFKACLEKYFPGVDMGC